MKLPVLFCFFKHQSFQHLALDDSTTVEVTARIFKAPDVWLENQMESSREPEKHMVMVERKVPDLMTAGGLLPPNRMPGSTL
jgi:hypothetical protein